MMIVGALFFASCVGITILAHLDNEKKQETFGKLVQACDGHPVAEAKAYVKGKDGHQIIVVRHRSEGSGWEIDTSHFPHGVEAVKEVDAVVCIEKHEELKIGSCGFYKKKFGMRIPGSDREYPRVIKLARVRVAAAQSGKELATSALFGPLPLRCADYHGKSPGNSDFEGAEPGLDEMVKFAAPLLETGVPPKIVPPVEKDEEGDDAAGTEEEK